MSKIRFDNIGDFINMVVSCVSDKEINVVAKYKEASEIIRHLMMSGNYQLQYVDIEPPDYGGYDGEYYIYINDKCSIGCEAARMEGRYYSLMSDIIFVINNCSSAVLKHINADFICEVEIGDEGVELPWVN